MDVILYNHGKGGSAAEAEHYRQLYPSLDGGDHWFHTDAQIQFLNHWIRDRSDY